MSLLLSFVLYFLIDYKCTIETVAPLNIRLQQEMQHRGKTYLFHMSLEVHVNTLSCFAIMSLHMFSSKAQECVHAHIQASLWLLRTRTNSNNEQQHEVNNHRHNSTFHRTSIYFREARRQGCTCYSVLYPHTSIPSNSVFSLLAKSISQEK